MASIPFLLFLKLADLFTFLVHLNLFFLTVLPAILLLLQLFFQFCEVQLPGWCFSHLLYQELANITAFDHIFRLFIFLRLSPVLSLFSQVFSALFDHVVKRARVIQSEVCEDVLVLPFSLLLFLCLSRVLTLGSFREGSLPLLMIAVGSLFTNPRLVHHSSLVHLLAFIILHDHVLSHWVLIVNDVQIVLLI